MSDDTDLPKNDHDTIAPEADSGEAEAPDPRDREIEQLRADRDRMSDLLSKFVQQPPQQARQDLPPTVPDFADAEDVGLTPAQARYLYGKVGASIAPVLEQVRPKPRTADEVFEEVMERASLNTEDNNARRMAIGVSVEHSRVLRQEGIDPASPQGIMRMAREVRREVGRQAQGQPARPSRTAGVGGASLPPGQKPRPEEKKPTSLCDAIRASQKKRGLY